MISNCSQCQFFDSNPHHFGDIRCTVNPTYPLMWQRLKSLDESILYTLPLDGCRDFDFISNGYRSVEETDRIIDQAFS